MTLPARNSPGSLGRLGFTGAATQEFADYVPRKGSTGARFEFESDVNGNLNFFRVFVNENGQIDEQALAINPVAVTGGTPLQQNVSDERQIRIQFVAVGAGQIHARAHDLGGPH